MYTLPSELPRTVGTGAIRMNRRALLQKLTKTRNYGVTRDIRYTNDQIEPESHMGLDVMIF